MDEIDTLALQECAKYTEIWGHKDYRAHSPGEMRADIAWETMRPKAGESLIDFGAGTGRATKRFQNMGLVVKAVDIVDNALETDVPFTQACLWSMPDDIGPTDWGYCCDVMEHIPTGKVDAVLGGIAKRVSNVCYFQIALFPDAYGQLIGKKLHLTVESNVWWVEKIGRHFASLRTLESTNSYLTCLARR